MTLPRRFLLLFWMACSLGGASSALAAQMPDFSLHRLGPGGGSTLLVVGGIQGDEPGGFSAAALLVTHYTITQGQVWVVPNLNFPSILVRSRGGCGDMNRKFAHVDAKDPDYSAVRRIQGIIVDPQVDLILNLHDGSGFYRPSYESPLKNPKRWGQCVIIDQDNLDARSFGALARMGQTAVAEANKALVKPEHRYHLKNTHTSKGDKEMEKTLSYFAVRNGKPAFGVEASKEFTTEFRSYYHIRILESFMRQMGIAFTRKFSLSPQGVKNAINSDVAVAFHDGRFVLPLDDARPSMGYVPLKKGGEQTPRFSKPLLALVAEAGAWRVAYGNRTLTRIVPQYMEYDESLESVDVMLDGKPATVRIGSTIVARDSFLVKSIPGYRANAIGAVKEKADGSECSVLLRKKDFTPRFSVDKSGTTYRVELYKGKAFAGMFLVRFGSPRPVSGKETLTATSGSESEFGF